MKIVQPEINKTFSCTCNEVVLYGVESFNENTFLLLYFSFFVLVVFLFDYAIFHLEKCFNRISITISMTLGKTQF